ncbi:l-allo-threonine aldolase [Usnea florida]
MAHRVTDHSISSSSGNGPNAWSTPGSAAFDFRSDTVTSPTASMLLATQSCTLQDDVFQEDPTTNSLEACIAEMTDKEAGLFVISGTMGNQLSIRTALGGPPHSVLTDARSHVYGWEAGGIASLSGALVLPIVPANGHHLTLFDVRKHAVTDTDVHYCPTHLISLENTLGGTILPLKDCQEISQWAHAQSPPIHMHLDGARLWEAVAAGAGELKEYCACFDSVTMCFSKGLGAPLGSIIVASRLFVEKARHIRKGLGGGLRQAGVVTASARISVDETFLGEKLSATHQRAREIADMWRTKGGKLTQATETNMVWLDLDAAGVSREEFVEMGVKEGVRFLGGRVVVHYQVSEEAVEKLARVMDAVLSAKPKKNEVENGVKEEAKEVMAPEME